MLNAVTKNRLKNVQSTLTSASEIIDDILANPDMDPDFVGLKELVRDALQILEQQSPTAPAKVYRRADHVYGNDGSDLGPNCPRDV